MNQADDSVRRSVEFFGLFCGFFAVAGSLWCLLDPCWKITSQDLSVQPYDICYGIWIGCALPSDGSWICDGYYGKTIIDLNVGGGITEVTEKNKTNEKTKARQHYCRAATISAILLSSLALVVASLGSRCCVAAFLSKKRKKLFGKMSGWMMMIGGILVGSTGVWYFVEIYEERVWYYMNSPPGLGYTPGRAIYVAMGSGLCGIVSGLCYIFYCHEGVNSEGETERFSHFKKSTNKSKEKIEDTSSHGFKKQNNQVSEYV